MKKLLAFFIIVPCSLYFSIGFLLRNPVMPPSFEAPRVQAQASRLRSDLEQIIATPEFRNYKNLNSLNMVPRYIKEVFDANCDSTAYQEYQVEGRSYKNVTCLFGRPSDERIVVGAHYDVAGEQQGADDNGSGTVSLLELARLIKELPQKRDHAIELVAYTLEEPPYFRTENMGSAIHAESLVKNKIDVIWMLSLEMLGFYTAESGTQDYPISVLHAFYPDHGDFITFVGSFNDFLLTRKLKSNLMKRMELDLYSINAPSSIRGVDFSDHLNYWNRGIKGFMLTDTAFYRNKNYHEETDTIEKLNFEKMAQLVSSLYELVQKK